MSETTRFRGLGERSPGTALMGRAAGPVEDAPLGKRSGAVPYSKALEHA